MKSQEKSRLVFVTALLAEARPLISYYALKKDSALTRFPVYRQGDISLLVSGVGKLKSAIATSWLLSQPGYGPGPLLVNIGFCGSDLAKHAPGHLLLAGKITDLDSGQDFYPDLPAQNSLPVTSCFCASRQILVQDPAAKTNEGCFDMESAGFFQAASVFTTVERIILIKMVSDQLEKDPIDLAGLQAILIKSLPELEKIWQPLLKATGPASAKTDTQLEKVLQRLAQKQRFTASMTQQLHQDARAALAAAHNPLPRLESALMEKVEHKREGRQLLARLIKELADE